MPLVQIKMLPGRTTEQKRQLTERINQAFEETMGVPASALWTLYEEVDAEDWFMGYDSIASKRRQQ